MPDNPLPLNIAKPELAQGRVDWMPPAPCYRRGVLAKCAKLPSSSSPGDVTDMGLV